MSKQMLVSEARDRFRQEMPKFRGNVLRALPDALKDCHPECRDRYIAEFEKRLDEVIATAEATFDGEQRSEA